MNIKRTIAIIIENINLWNISLFKLIFRVKDNYIMLESEGDYTDNIKVFYDYLVRNGFNSQYRIIWIVHEPRKYPPKKGVVFVSRFKKSIRFKFNYYVATSKVFIFSHPSWIKEWREEQVVINTTHSAAQLKKPTPPKNKTSDYALCCSSYGQDVKHEALGIDKNNILILGMPRIDLLYQHKDCLKIIDPLYNGEKIIISMETFKQSKNWNDSKTINPYAINVIHCMEELKILDNFLKESNIKLLIKIHHLQDLYFLNRTNLDNILYITDDVLRKKDIQVNELLENASILLTDYSSVYYEFLLLDRPIGFLIGDIADYSRGFIMKNPFDEMPGEKITSLKELLEFVEKCELKKDEYVEKRRKLRIKTFLYEDDKNSERLYKSLDSIIKGDITNGR